MDILNDAIDIIGQQVLRLKNPLTLEQISAPDALAQVLDPLTRECFTTNHYLEAIIFRRIVAAGDHDPRVAAQKMGGEIEYRRGHLTQIHYILATLHQATGQRFTQGLARISPVTGDDNGLLPLLPGRTAYRTPDQVDTFGIQRFIHYTPDIVGTEDACRQGYRRYRGNRFGHLWLQGL